MILADLKSMDQSSMSSTMNHSDGSSHDQPAAAANSTMSNNYQSLYVAQKLQKRSVVLESWASSDYDPRHHHAYCEVSSNCADLYLYI
jgi:3-keto-L-gulonate-6-phosphate decarboxylase